MKCIFVMTCLLFSVSTFASPSKSTCKEFAMKLATSAFRVSYPKQVKPKADVSIKLGGSKQGSSIWNIDFTRGKPVEWGIGYKVTVFTHPASGDCFLKTMTSDLLAD